MRATSFLWSVSSGKGGKHCPVGHDLSLGLPGSLPRTAPIPVFRAARPKEKVACVWKPPTHTDQPWASFLVESSTAEPHKAHTASQSLMLIPLHQNHRALPSAQVVPGERQQLGHNSTLHPQPLGSTHIFWCTIFMNHSCCSRCSHHSPLSQQRESPTQWDFKDKVYRAATVSATFSTALMNTSRVQGSHHRGHLCLNRPVHKQEIKCPCFWQHLSPWCYEKEPSPAPLTSGYKGLASPPSFTTKLEAGSSLAPDEMSISKMHVFHLSAPTNIPICWENKSFLPQ